LNASGSRNESVHRTNRVANNAAITKRSTHSQHHRRLRFTCRLSAPLHFRKISERESREDSDQGSEKHIRARRWKMSNRCRFNDAETVSVSCRLSEQQQRAAKRHIRTPSVPRARACRLCSVLCSVLFNVHVSKIYRPGACSDRRRTD
jgi:hypothetical protein